MANSNIFNNGTNVGIGTASPHSQARLHLAGNGVINQLRFSVLDETADNKHWAFGPNGTNFYGYTSNDAQNVTANWLQVIRAGNTVSSVNFPNGNVGIGTNAPTTKLHVAGSFRLVDGTQAAGRVLTSDANGVATWQAVAGGGLPAGGNTQTLRHDGANWVTNSTLTNNGTEISVGNDDRIYITKGEIKFTNNFVAHWSIFNRDDAGGKFQINNTGVNFATNTVGTNVFTITPANNVGIGTADPTTKLHVAGSFRLVDGTQAAGRVLTSDANGVATWQAAAGGLPAGTSGQTLRHDGTNWVANSNIFNNGTNVGIGTATPNAALQFANVVANRRLVLWENANNDHQFYGLGINGSMLRYQVDATSSDHAFYAGNGTGSSVEIMRIRGNGRVGIGTTGPDQTLSVNGDASKVGGGTWATFSDKRLKKNINEFSDGLDKLMQINPVSFQYNGLAGYTNDSTTFVGVIAQDVEKVAPYMIEHVQKKLNENDSVNTDLLMYDGSALTYILVNAVKEQQTIIEAQKKEIEVLKAEVDLNANKNNLEIILLKEQVQQLFKLIQEQETFSVKK